MTMTSAAAWADLLRSSTALREVLFGGVAAAVESFAAMCSEVTRVCWRGVVGAGETMGDDEVTMLADAAAACRQLTLLGFEGSCWHECVCCWGRCRR